MSLGIAVLASLLVAVGGVIPAASAPPPIARAHLELRAPADCVGPSDLIARVAVRSPRVQFLGDAAAIGVRATFAMARPGEVSAELVLVDSGVARAQRRFLTRTCAEAADAVALMIAVALDPGWVNDHRPLAAGTPAAVGSPERGSGSSAAGQGTSTVKGEVAEAAIAKDSGRPLPPLPASPPLRPAPDLTATPGIRVERRASVFFAGQAIWGPAPGAMPGVAVYAVGALDRQSIWSPAIAAGAIHAWRSGIAEPGGVASFSLDAATVDACALRVQLSAVNVRTCAAVLIGRLSASGSDTDAPATFAKLFAAAGAAGVLTADLGARVEVAARLGAGLTLRRDSYEFATAVFHTASRFTTSASLGVGLRLW